MSVISTQLIKVMNSVMSTAGSSGVLVSSGLETQEAIGEYKLLLPSYFQLE